MQYDPEIGPQPAAWLALDEAARLQLVEEWHVAHDPDVASLTGHAAAHVAIESQLALGDPPAIRAALDRLVHVDGLGRHEAIHALAGVMMGLVADMLSNRMRPEAFAARYTASLSALTAESWRGQPVPGRRR